MERALYRIAEAAEALSPRRGFVSARRIPAEAIREFIAAHERDAKEIGTASAPPNR